MIPMTWSKVLSYILNLGLSVWLWSYLTVAGVDPKLSGGIYAAYVLAYMFFSDLFTKLDKGSSLSKALKETQLHKAKITKYESCILNVHDSIIICLRDNLKGVSLKHSLSAMTMQLSAITIDVTNDLDDPNIKKPEPISSTITKGMEESDIFIAGQSRD